MALRTKVCGRIYAHIRLNRTIVSDSYEQKHRPVSLAWIDYAKAFDSVRLTWIHQVVAKSSENSILNREVPGRAAQVMKSKIRNRRLQGTRTLELTTTNRIRSAAGEQLQPVAILNFNGTPSSP